MKHEIVRFRDRLCFSGQWRTDISNIQCVTIKFPDCSHCIQLKWRWSELLPPKYSSTSYQQMVGISKSNQWQFMGSSLVSCVFNCCHGAKSCCQILFRLGKTPMEAYEMLQTVCGDEAISHSIVSEGIKWLKDGREKLRDDPRSGCAWASRNAVAIAGIREMATRGRRWALKKMADELNTNQILHTDLQKRKICVKFVTQTHGRVEAV
jgi:hypothetical protein